MLEPILANSVIESAVLYGVIGGVAGGVIGGAVGALKARQSESNASLERGLIGPARRRVELRTPRPAGLVLAALQAVEPTAPHQAFGAEAGDGPGEAGVVVFGTAAGRLHGGCYHRVRVRRGVSETVVVVETRAKLSPKGPASPRMHDAFVTAAREWIEAIEPDEQEDTTA